MEDHLYGKRLHVPPYEVYSGLFIVVRFKPKKPLWLGSYLMHPTSLCCEHLSWWLLTSMMCILIPFSLSLSLLSFHPVLFLFLFFFTTPPILVASVNSIKFIHRIEETTYHFLEVSYLCCSCMINHLATTVVLYHNIARHFGWKLHLHLEG